MDDYRVPWTFYGQAFIGSYVRVVARDVQDALSQAAQRLNNPLIQLGTPEVIREQSTRNRG